MENIRNEIFQRAEHFALKYDEDALKSNGIRMKAPMLFVLLGDKVSEGIAHIKRAVERSMSNSEGIIYLSIGSKKEVCGSEIFHIGLDVKEEDRGAVSRVIEEERFLKVLNEEVTKVSQCILEKNKVFSYWEQIHVSVITAASDKANVLLSDIVVLIKSKLEQSFKQVFTDLFVLLEESGEDAVPLNKALSYSLFKELDDFEDNQYHYAKPIELLDDDMRLITEYNGPLFHLVYLLSDKKENGQMVNEAKKSHYESIVAVNLLKNREQKAVELEEAREQYNYNTFMNNIRESMENRYCTARLAKVRKPGQGIYLTVAYHLFKAYEKTLSYEGHDYKVLLDQIGLSERQIDNVMSTFMPSEEGVEEIRSLISNGVSFKDLKNNTFSEAETMLYGNLAKDFFEVNFTKVASRKITDYIGKEKFKERLLSGVVRHPDYGPFALGEFLKSESYSELERQKDKYLYQMKQYELEVQEKENKLVGECIGGNFGLFDKKYIQKVKDYLIEEVYKARYQYERENLKLKLLQSLQDEIENFYKVLQSELVKLEKVENFFMEMIHEANRYEEEYLVQNVKEYYEKVVLERLETLKKAKGEHFLQEDKYMGTCDKVLSESEECIIEKVCHIAEEEFLKEEKYFNGTFEEELLARANMLVEYEETDVAAKSQLYELLYESLEENSKPCVHIDTTLAPHRYVEKYFFGNRQSEFIEYAYKRDQSSRNYKIGTVNDKRKSVIEKLQLMGGFKLSDLVFTRSAQRYYEAYKEKGYKFHSSEQ